jgi:hypothetical protein
MPVGHPPSCNYPGTATTKCLTRIVLAAGIRDEICKGMPGQEASCEFTSPQCRHDANFESAHSYVHSTEPQETSMKHKERKFRFWTWALSIPTGYLEYRIEASYQKIHVRQYIALACMYLAVVHGQKPRTRTRTHARKHACVPMRI